MALPKGPRNSCRPRIFFTLLLLLYAAGLRLGEAVRLRVSDVDFAVGLIRFRGRRVKGGYGVQHGRGVEQAAAA